MKSLMRSILGILVVAFFALGITACDRVPVGYVGVKVDKYGSDKGVNAEVKGPGRYYVGFNSEIFPFPTFNQTYIWENNKDGDESFTFNSSQGLSISTDVSISYSIQPDNVVRVFQKYRRGVDEITGIYLRAMVRDALTNQASQMDTEDIYGKGKPRLQKAVFEEVASKAAAVGITVDNVAFVNTMRLPPQVVASINSKIAASQLAQQKETELLSAQADAAKEVAKAEGDAKAMEAKAKVLRDNPELLQAMFYDHWDGHYPQYYSGQGLPTPLFNIAK